MTFSIDSLVSEAAGSGWVMLQDVTPTATGNVGAKVYQTAADDILLSCEGDTYNLDVLVRAVGPRVSVNGTLADLPFVSGTSHYEGTVSITVTGTGPITARQITPSGDPGSASTCNYTYQVGPTVLTCVFTGGYPGSQTELKAGDTFQITGTTNVDATAIEVQDYGACVYGLTSIVAGTSFLVTGTIADRGLTTQNLAARVRARNATLTFGAVFYTNATGSVDGVNLVKLNNTYPTVTIGSIAYPGSQAALKGSETATVGMTTANLNTISFTSPNGDLSITNPSLNEPTKTVQRIAGSYNVATTNFRAQATRTANAAVTTSNTVVKIANAVPVVSVSPPAARLRSGGNNGTSAQNHTITLTSDQQLLVAPTLNAGVGGGTFLGSWAGGPSVWTRSLQVHDNDTKGTYAFTGLLATNLAGQTTSVISGSANYVLGGFVSRTVTFPAFSPNGTINVEVVTYTKLTAGNFTATNQPSTRNPTQGNTSNLVDTYTVLTLATNPTTVYWNDAAAVSANSSGTAQLLAVEETI